MTQEQDNQEVTNVTLQSVRSDWWIATHKDKKGKIWQGFGTTGQEAMESLLDEILK